MVTADFAGGFSSGDGPQSEIEQTYASPVEELGFEISPTDKRWSFSPKFYPDRFTQMKEKELKRYGGKCDSESVSIKSIKNREFHATGVILQGEINIFQALLDYPDSVDLLSPLTPFGGMECYLKKGELGQQSGWDPEHQQWMFEYTLDLVSTGRDESESNERNVIISEITQSDPSPR